MLTHNLEGRRDIAHKDRVFWGTLSEKTKTYDPPLPQKLSITIRKGCSQLLRKVLLTIIALGQVILNPISDGLRKLPFPSHAERFQPIHDLKDSEDRRENKRDVAGELTVMYTSLAGV